MSALQPVPMSVSAESSKGVSKLEQLLKPLESTGFKQLPSYPVPAHQSEVSPVASHGKEHIASLSMHSPKVRTDSSVDSSLEVATYVDEEEDEFFDKMCRTILRCVLRQSWIEEEKQHQLKKHVVRVHAHWFDGKMSRTQFRDSVTSFLCAMCPETGKADLDILFRIWDEHDFYMLEQYKNISMQRTGNGLTRHRSTTPPSLTSTCKPTVQPAALNSGNASGPVITQDQLVVGYFCRHSIILLSRIMSRNSKCSERVAQLKELIKNVWGQWAKSQITRAQLLGLIVAFVCKSCPEAEGVDVVQEFNVWCRQEFEMQQQRKKYNTNTTKIDHVQNVSVTPPSQVPTIPISTPVPANEQLRLNVSSKSSVTTLTEEQKIVARYCKHSILLLSHVTDEKSEALEKVAQLKEFIKRVWTEWVLGQISHVEVFNSVASFVNGTFHEAGKLNLFLNLKVWYTKEYEKQRQRSNASLTDACVGQSSASPNAL